ncbi:MAG: (Fe-S)-binding protein [Armatimonadetes bacterium]|nr:(Fe-S)-binding protein [Akkermansiaceae bacterium]
MHCGMCLPTCPTYDTTKRERNSPRGRIALMRAIAEDELPVTREFADEMSYCLGCLACQTACPAGVDYATLFETARADIEQARINPSPTRGFYRFVTLHLLFIHPRLLRVFGKLLRFYQTSGAETLVRKLHLTRLLPANLRRLEPQTPRISEKFSNELIAPLEQPATDPVKHRVALLTGCIQDIAFSEINRDTADVLLANSCEVHTPPVQPCCGSIHSHNGETELARDVARRLINLIPPEKFDAIITNAGGCGSHLRHYTHLLEDDPDYSSRARLWDQKIQDIHEFLAKIQIRPPTAAPFDDETKVTYHDSCHLTHGQKVTLQPRQIIDLIPGLKRVELPEANWCCGSAGVYSITQPEQATLLLNRKVEKIQSTGATHLLTANPGCHLQIQNAMPALKVIHPISVLAQAYRNESISLN